MPAKDLAATRRALGLGKEAFARLVGVGVSTVHRWERGDTGPAGLALHFYRAARAALSRGYTAEQILGDRAGDPGVVMAGVFALGFLEDGRGTTRSKRSRSRARSGT